MQKERIQANTRMTQIIEDKKTVELLDELAQLRQRVATLETRLAEKNRLIRSLEENEIRFRHLFEQAPYAIQGYNRNREVIFWNKANEQVYGYTRAEVLGKKLEDLIIPEPMRQGVIDAVNTWVTDNIPIPAGELGLLHKNGSIVPVYSGHAMLVNIYGEPEMYCMDIDLTGLKKTEESLRRSEEQLRQAQKMEAIGTLAGGVAHDFNNLLTVINGNAELALLKLTGTDLVDREIGTILKAGHRAEELTRQLLAFSRKQMYEPVILDINQLIAGLDKMIRRLISEDIIIRTVFTPDIPPIKADPGQIEQVLINLMINARDAIYEKNDPSSAKQITIETTQTLITELSFDTCAECPPDTYVVIAVSDTGIGMAEELKERIFEPFFTTKSTGKGTGLGLAMVYGIVKQNNGGIYIETTRGKGTCFRIFWPAANQSVTDLPAEKAPSSLVSGNEVIMLVEDDAQVREFTQQALTRMGYQIITAVNGVKALELLAQDPGPIDLLITDVIMPDMNGTDLAQTLQAQNPALPVLFISGHPSNFLGQSGLIDQNIHLLQKPFSLHLLAQTVREVLEKQ